MTKLLLLLWCLYTFIQKVTLSHHMGQFFAIIKHSKNLSFVIYPCDSYWQTFLSYFPIQFFIALISKRHFWRHILYTSISSITFYVFKKKDKNSISIHTNPLISTIFYTYNGYGIRYIFERHQRAMISYLIYCLFLRH